MYETWTAVLNCPCKEFPPAKNMVPVLAAYYEARRRSTREGFVPVLVTVGEDSPLDGFQWMKNETPEAYRKRMLSRSVEDGGALLAQMTAQHKEYAAEDGCDWPGEDLLGPMEGGEAIEHFLGISDFQGGTLPLVLAELPVKRPWEVFAWIPFGGWNECPGSEEQMATAKYWYEKYGAVPAVMTRDVLEYDLPAPVRREEAMALALEQYAFCPDIVEQGCGTIGYLADTLAKSNKWYFWWD